MKKITQWFWIVFKPFMNWINTMGQKVKPFLATIYRPFLQMKRWVDQKTAPISRWWSHLLYRIPSRIREKVSGLFFVSPWIIGFILFALYPMGYSIYLSLNSVRITVNGIEPTWVGFENYTRAFATDRVMIEYLMGFLQDSIVMILVINVFALLFAIILSGKIRMRGFFRVIFFLPVIVISGPVMKELVNAGAITIGSIEHLDILYALYELFGEGIFNFFLNTFENLIYMFWFSGVQLLVYLAVLQKRDAGIYEAAEIDGASPWETFWKITLPSLKPVIFINVVYTIILLATFDNNNVILEIKNVMFVADKGFGFSSALAWIYFFALIGLILIAFLALMVTRRQKIAFSFYSNEYEHSQLRYQHLHSWYHANRTVSNVRHFFLGRKMTDGFLMKLASYGLLVAVSFAFLYPFIYLGLKSIQNLDDILNPAVSLIPTALYFENYVKSFEVLNFWESLKQSIIYAGVPTLAQIFSASLIGYGLSRYQFPFKKTITGLIIVTFVIPPQILMIPTYLLYKDWGILGSINAFLYPALLGQGFKSAIFIMLFYQSFNNIPKVIDEAAKVDGASALSIYFRIALRLSIPIIIVSFLFSFIWYWNESYLTSLYLENSATGTFLSTLPLQLSRFAATFRNLYPATSDQGVNMTNILNEAVYMAGTMITILPLLVLYFIMQKWFVESSDKAGITGE